MRIITLLTDFGLKDNFVGVMKGVILGINPVAKIVDISHNVEPHNVLEAAFLLKASYCYFPHRTIHLVIIDPNVGTERRAIIVKTKNYYFLGPDNGVLSLSLKDDNIEEIVQITNFRYFLKPLSNTFHGRDIFAPVAAHLSSGKRLITFGKRIMHITELNLPKVKVMPKELTGEVVYIDRFGNLITNIEDTMLKSFIRGSRFKIEVKNRRIGKINTSYAQAKERFPLAIINSFGNLEISLNQKSACDYFRAEKGLKVKIVKQSLKEHSRPPQKP